MTVKITPNDKGNPPGKLAEAELHFTDGVLEGLKAEHGVPESESIRRAIAAYLAEKGVLPQVRPKTPPTQRKRKS